MKKALVVYKSAYGSTKKYAEWIADELKCDILEKDKCKKEQLKDYDIIIYGGGLYAGKVNGIELITSEFENIKDKSIILFTCGLADTEDSKNIQHIISDINKVFTDDMKRLIKIYCFRGGIDYSKLSFVHKMMMAMMYKVIVGKSRKSKDEWEKNKAFIESYGKEIDFTDREAVVPLVKYVRKLQNI